MGLGRAMVARVRNGGMCLASLLLFGCASAQLNFNTLDVASTVQDVYYRQTLLNLSRTIDDPSAVPSQVDLAAGTIQTTASVTPSATTPLGRSVTRGATSAITGFSTAGTGASLSASDSWTQNWNISPITDADTLRNLRALYRYAVFGGDIRQDYHPPHTAKGALDPYMLLQPHCVLCGKKLEPNAKLHGGGWLYWTNDFGVVAATHPPPPDAVDLGHYGRHELYLALEDYQQGYLSDFILFVLPVIEPSSGGGQGGGGGGTPRKPNVNLVPQAIPLTQ